MVRLKVKELDKIIADYVWDRETPLGLFYARDRKKYIGLDNSRGTCIVREFETENECQLWLSFVK